MDTIAPTLATAYALLREDIAAYLDAAEFAVEPRAAEWSREDVESLCALVGDLTTIVRGVLSHHHGDAAGSCPTCRTAWPCSAVCTVHDLVKDPAGAFVRLVLGETH